MNIILEKISEGLDGWEVNETQAFKASEPYSANMQMMLGYFRTGIYHRGFPIWEQDHMGKDVIELQSVLKDLNTELVIANENPRAYINGVVNHDIKSAMEAN